MPTLMCKTVDDLSVQRLRNILTTPSLQSFTSTRIGTGQAGFVYRIRLTYAQEDSHDNNEDQPLLPASVILKLASPDADACRAGISLGLYEREVRFYTDIAPTLLAHATSSISRSHAAAFDVTTGACTILLSDAGDAAGTTHVGNDIRGATITQARAAMDELGCIHAAFLRRAPELEAMQALSKAWLQRKSLLTGALFAQLWVEFKARYAACMATAHIAVCERYVATFDGFQELVGQTCVMGMIHGDYRMYNMLFSTPALQGDERQSVEENALTIVDWQTVTWGPLAGDVAYFLGCALTTENRRLWSEELLQTYCDAAGEQNGDPLYPLDKCQADVRRQGFFGIAMVIASSMLTEQTERGDDMSMTMLSRHCELVLDLGSLDLLPTVAPQVQLRPGFGV